jgi:hypothetical protein
MIEDQLETLLQKLNEAAADRFKYSAKITTTAKGDGQIHCSVRSNESVEDTKILLESLIQKTLQVMEQNGIKLPVVKNV